MANLKAKISAQTKLKGKAKSQQTLVAQSAKIGQFDIGLGELSNVDTAGQADGAVMQYNASAGKYVITTTLENENLNINSGTY
jgi:hypothetical protein